MKSIIFKFLIVLILTFYICESFAQTEKNGQNKRPNGGLNKKTTRKTTRRPLDSGSSDSESGYESERGDGTYNQRNKEKKNLKKNHGKEINGLTHEAEHPVGYQVLAEDLRDLGVKRNDVVGRTIENSAPAYYEKTELHRSHAGTGSGKKADEYRGWQKEALKAGKVGNAIQINQLEYAQNPKFQQTANSPEGKIATDSFNNMIVNNPEFLVGKTDGSFKAVKMTRGEQIEAMLSRKLATEGKSFYTQNDVDDVKKNFQKGDKKLAENYF